MAKSKPSAVKVQIQGSQLNVNGHNNYGGRHISFDDSCKKDDGDEVRTNRKQNSNQILFPKINTNIKTTEQIFFFVTIEKLNKFKHFIYWPENSKILKFKIQ